jgi:diphthamide biosynthesis enzyme Dph1/Dph2-like protein
VEIHFSTDHLIETIKENFAKNSKISVLGTVQFLKAIQDCKQQLADVFDRIDVPQVKPLSQGTVKFGFVYFLLLIGLL